MPSSAKGAIEVQTTGRAEQKACDTTGLFSPAASVTSTSRCSPVHVGAGFKPAPTCYAHALARSPDELLATSGEHPPGVRNRAQSGLHEPPPTGAK
jgi:hypothetical protein